MRLSGLAQAGKLQSFAIDRRLSRLPASHGEYCGCVSISCAINMAESSNFAPDEATVIMALSGLFLGPFRDVKEIPFPRLAVIW